MNPIPPNVTQNEERLGELAIKFRGTRRQRERQAIAAEYAETVERLTQSGGWHERPAPEDQLPDAWMSEAFFEYWSRQDNP